MKSVIHQIRGAFVIALLLVFVWLASPSLACVFAALVVWAELGAAWSAYQWRKGHYSTYRGKCWRFGSVHVGGFSVRVGKLCVGVRVELFRAHFFDWFARHVWFCQHERVVDGYGERYTRFALPLLFRITSFARPRDGWALALWRVYYGPLDVCWHRYYPAQERREQDAFAPGSNTWAGKWALIVRG